MLASGYIYESFYCSYIYINFDIQIPAVQINSDLLPSGSEQHEVLLFGSI